MTCTDSPSSPSALPWLPSPGATRRAQLLRRRGFQAKILRGIGRDALADGRQVFLEQCALCHGPGGRGDGPTARYLWPKPRDLARDQFKSAMGATVTMAGFRRALRLGMPGSAMPRFAALAEVEIAALFAFVSSLRADDDRPSPAAPSVARQGRAVFLALQCGQCHGASGAGDGPSAAGVVDVDEEHVPIPDLRRPRSFRSGASDDDLTRDIRDGIPGTPMPAYRDAVAPEQTLLLVEYLKSLFLQTPNK